ncbi:hypothetical protein LVD17_27135 [Fulvivirga ulvae]|uniref:avidin/streptavidin family protein n=1 Tax=Fulvivirga ulvae TaxID=2904245 RepID=UPI001F20FF6C|nr:avidin/streptavidin family protein [Fulvivirga ulvae]UII31967.1 hypothetical protein LVD17_27135 [Fulvivirga ulvae]
MKLPLCFYEKRSFSVFIDSLNQHSISGRFKANNHDLELIHTFNGLVYQLTNKIYNFTFSIEWDHSDVPSFTTFTGILHLNNNTNQNLLDLKWLLVTSNQKNSLQGFSRLSEEYDPHDHNEKRLPFPKQKLNSKAPSY